MAPRPPMPMPPMPLRPAPPTNATLWAAAAMALLAVAVFVVRYVLTWMVGMDADCWHGPTGAFLPDPSGRPTPVPPGFRGLVSHVPSHPIPAAGGGASLFSPASKSLSVVVPAYNEQSRLPGMLDSTLAYLKARAKREPGFTWEVIVVDDGSTDSTAAAAARFTAAEGFESVRVLRLGANRGKGSAVKRGCLAARGGRVLFADADGATAIADLESLEATLPRAAGAAGLSGRVELPPGLAVGSRAHLQAAAVAQRAWYRNAAMHVFHWAVSAATGTPVRDSQCGFKLASRAAARAMYPNQRLRRWGFDAELLYLARVTGVPVTEVGVHWTEVPGSKLRLTSLVHIFCELAAVPLGYRTGLWAIASPEAAAASAAAAAAGRGAR